MKFRIFADSWAWLWGDQIVKSKSMIAHSGSPYRFSLVKTILEGMGHEVDITNSKPGASLDYTTEKILESLDNLPEYFQGEEIWLHMISSPARDIDPNRADLSYSNFNFNNIDDFFKSHDQEITRQLQRISDRLHGIQSNITIFEMGGHVVLPKHCFDSIKNCNPKLKFGCEWILKDASENIPIDRETGQDLNGYVRDYLHRLWDEKWTEIPDDGTGPFEHLRWNQAYRVFFQPGEVIGEVFANPNINIEPDLEFLEFLNDIYDARVEIFGHYQVLTMFPDTGHLGWIGHIKFADWILCKAEELGFIDH